MNYTELFVALDIVIIILLMIVAALLVSGVQLIAGALERKIDHSNKVLRREIRESVEPNFIKIEPSAESLANLAVEVWRLSKKLEEAKSSLSDDLNQKMQNSVTKFERFLAKHDLEVKEYTGQKYNPGMNLDILNTEKNPGSEQSIISQTHEPAVMHLGTLIKKAKVIINEQ
jgi:hypothetical protein